MTHDLSTDSQALVQGRGQALPELFSRYRERLMRMVEFRLDPRLRGRIDAADVLQESYMRLAGRVAQYAGDPRVSCFVWMRQQTLQTLIDLQRTHFREARSPQREVARRGGEGDATSIAMANYIVGEMTSPSQAMVKAEEIDRVRSALETLNEIDREVLALRHFEMLSNSEVAEVLELTPTAASNRYVRAAARLAEILREADAASIDKVSRHSGRSG